MSSASSACFWKRRRKRRRKEEEEEKEEEKEEEEEEEEVAEVSQRTRARTPPPIGVINNGRVTPGEGQPPEQHMSHMSGTFQGDPNPKP